MNLRDEIKSNPYLKPSNCTDLSDVDYAISELRRLDAKYGSENKTLLKVWAGILERKKQLTPEPQSSGLHPIFEQALKPFGVYSVGSGR